MHCLCWYVCFGWSTASLSALNGSERRLGVLPLGCSNTCSSAHRRRPPDMIRSSCIWATGRGCGKNCWACTCYAGSEHRACCDGIATLRNASCTCQSVARAAGLRSPWAAGQPRGCGAAGAPAAVAVAATANVCSLQVWGHAPACAPLLPQQVTSSSLAAVPWRLQHSQSATSDSPSAVSNGRTRSKPPPTAPQQHRSCKTISSSSSGSQHLLSLLL